MKFSASRRTKEWIFTTALRNKFWPTEIRRELNSWPLRCPKPFALANFSPSHFACNPPIGANAIKWAWSANSWYEQEEKNNKKSMPRHAGEHSFFRSHRKQIEMQTTQNCRCIGCRAGEKRGQWVGFGGSIYIYIYYLSETLVKLKISKCRIFNNYPQRLYYKFGLFYNFRDSSRELGIDKLNWNIQPLWEHKANLIFRRLILEIYPVLWKSKGLEYSKSHTQMCYKKSD